MQIILSCSLNIWKLFLLHIIIVQEIIKFPYIIQDQMFLTQTQTFCGNKTQKARSASRSFAKNKSLVREKFYKLSGPNLDYKNSIEKKLENKNSFAFDNTAKLRISNPEKKWKKIVDLYNIPYQQNEQKQIKAIRQGPSFYRILANQKLLKRHNLKINFPQTFLQISGELIFIRTNLETGFIEASKVQRQRYQQIMEATLIRQNNLLKECKLKYKQHYDIKFNPHAPVIVTKISQDHGKMFEVDVQTYRNFQQRRSKPSANKIIQRFIYPRNMRAIIMRICYFKTQRGEQHGQFYAYRFQNIDNIFRINKKNSQIYQTFKLQSTISAAYERQNKIEYSKIINMKGLQKYIQPSINLIQFLEQSQNMKINSIFIDYVIDLFDRPWLINIKRISYQENKQSNPYSSLHISTRNSLHTAGSYGICRLCSIQYEKKYLRKSISNKMLNQFLTHLKKRMKVNEFRQIEFIRDIVKKNTKNYLTLQVCEGCYKIVAQEYKLIQSQQKLAMIYSTSAKAQLQEIKSRPITLQTKLRQWRLMFYFVSLQNIPTKLLRQLNQIVLKYSLGSHAGIQHSWKINTSYQIKSNNFKGQFKIDVDLNKIKMHYFYSESQQISCFLKQTEVNLQLAGTKAQKIFAKGSSGALSTFCRQTHPQLCLRQTLSVLLFYEDGKYCQLTMKVGLICDGFYQIPQTVSLIPVNKVYFAQSNYTNSNPIPRQWMEAFGVNQEIQIQQLNQQKDYQDLINNDMQDQFIQFATRLIPKNQKSHSKNKFVRKSLHLFH